MKTSGVSPEIITALARFAEARGDAREFCGDSLNHLRKTGMLGFLVPVEFGGLGKSLSEFGAAAVALGGACLNSAFMWTMHCQQVDAIVYFGLEELRNDILPAIADGRIYCASITTELRSGSRLTVADAPLVSSGDELILAREGPVVTGAQEADAFLISMRQSEEAPAGNVTLVYAPRRDVVLDNVREVMMAGMRGLGNSAIRIGGRVSRAQVIGGEGKFRQVAVESMIPVGHIGWAGAWLGAARGAVRDFLAEMRQSDQRVGFTRSPVRRERLARIRLDLEAVSSYLGATATAIDERRREGRSLDSPEIHIHLNTLKVMASELTFRAVDQLVDLAGVFLGYCEDSPIPLYRVWRDLRAARLNFSNDKLLDAIGTLQLVDSDVRVIGLSLR